MSLKVLMFGWELAPIVYGGLGVVCRSITERLIQSNIQVTYVIPKLPVPIDIPNLNLVNASEIVLDEKMFSKLSINSTLTPYINNESYTQFVNFLRKNHLGEQNSDVYGMNLFTEVERYSYRARDLVKSAEFDVIHCHDWMTFKAGVFAKQISGKPLVVHVHATEYDRSAGNPNPAVLDYEKYGLENADKIIAVSNFTKDKIVEKYQIDPSKIRVVHNAIEKNITTSAVRPDMTKQNDEKMVLFLGRLTIAKGADYLLQAAQKVISIVPDAKFVFVGKGEMIKELIDMSIELGISENIVFTGWLNHEQVDQAYKQADLFVMPSITEPFGLTALEAMRNGTPVLLSRQSGVSEVVQNCLKVDFWDIDAMANKILSVLRYQPLQETLRENGNHDVNHLSWESQTNKIIDLYKEVITNEH